MTSSKTIYFILFPSITIQLIIIITVTILLRTYLALLTFFIQVINMDYAENFSSKEQGKTVCQLHVKMGAVRVQLQRLSALDLVLTSFQEILVIVGKPTLHNYI